MPWLPSAPTTSPPRHQGGTAASVLTHEPGVLLCPLRCPRVSLHVLLLCLHMFLSCAIHYTLSCIPRCSPASSLMSPCVFISHVLLLCHHVFLCLLMSSSCSSICSPPVSSYILLVSPAVFPLNVLLCLFAIILPSLVPSFKSLFCVHVFMKLFKSSTLYTDLFILCPHLTRIFYSTIK